VGYAFGDWTRFAVQVTISCNAGTSDCNSIQYCVDASNGCDPSASGTAYSGSASISAEGASYIRYASKNSNGTWGDTSSSTVKIDLSNPSISISEDASPTWTNKDTISVSASDSVSGIAATRWVARTDSACGIAQDGELDSSGTSGATMYADDESRYQGRYICFQATDAAGNRNYAVSSQITRLDTTDPLVDAGPDRRTNALFIQSAVATDSGSGIASYLWSESSGPGTVYFGSPNALGTAISADRDGNYVIGVRVADNAGNSAYDSFNLHWSTTPPNISIGNPGTNMAQSKTISATASKGTFTMSVTDSSVCDNSLPFVPYASTTFFSESDNGKRICYRAIDDAGNAAYKMSDPISGIAIPKPVITLIGKHEATVETGGSYTDAGATANDNYDGDITSKMVSKSNVDANVLGNYTVTYNVNDSYGKEAASAVRTVHVVDTTKPVLTLKGNSTVSFEVDTGYSDAGAKAADSYDGDITSKIIVGNRMNPGFAGTYYITYDVTDSSGNRADRIARKVTVTDSTWKLLVIDCAAMVALAVLLVIELEIRRYLLH